MVRKSRGFYPWGGFNSDSRQVVSSGMWVNLWFSDEGHSHGASLSPYVNLRVSSQIQASLGAGISRDQNNTQWFGNFTDSVGGTPAATHFTFAHLAQRTISMTARLSYAMTKDLTFEFYGQPFVSSGTYSNVREVSATPDASSYDARYQPYTPPAGSTMAVKSTQLRSNSVLRWEYSPGSTLYVVWTHGRDDETVHDMDQSWMHDYRELFALHPDNTFLVKVAYWLTR